MSSRRSFLGACLAAPLAFLGSTVVASPSKTNDWYACLTEEGKKKRLKLGKLETKEIDLDQIHVYEADVDWRKRCICKELAGTSGGICVYCLDQGRYLYDPGVIIGSGVMPSHDIRAGESGEYNCMIQDFEINMDLGREELFELGRVQGRLL